MGTMVNLPAGPLRNPVSLATALRTGELGDNTASVLTVLNAANQASAFKSQDLDAAIDSWHKAINKEDASAQIAAILESRAKQLAPIVAQASWNFLGTVRFAPREKFFAEINEAFKAPAVTKNIIFGEELIKIAEAGFEQIRAGMLPIPGGTFRMGYDGPNAYGWEKPVHVVTLSPFQMGQTPVTNRDYEAWVKSLGDKRLFLVRLDPITGWPRVMAWGTKASIEPFKSKVRRQIVEVMGTEVAVQDFMDALEIWEVELHKPPKKFDRPFQPRVLVRWRESYLYAFMHGTRLATSAESEYAASEGGKKRFATPSGEFDANVIHSSVKKSQRATADVNRPDVVAGPYGLIDMNGNVWEWTMDWWENYSYGSFTNPTGPVTGADKDLRGGSWFNGIAGVLSVSGRSKYNPSHRNDLIGFRLVRPLDK